MNELNQLQTEMADALSELYTTDVSAETLQIDGRPIPGSLSFELSALDLVAAGWDEKVSAVFSTLKRYFPTGKWPREMHSVADYSVNGNPRKLQVVQMQGNHDSRAQLLIGLGSFSNPK